MKLADAVVDAMRSSTHLVAEAPTGVGKTLGYLVPAIMMGERVIVSTHTKNLQDQLLDKDIPRLADALRRVGIQLVEAESDSPLVPLGGLSSGRKEVRYSVMKGRNNYLCRDRLARRTRQGSLLFADKSDELLHEIADWAQSSRRGDRSELVGLQEQSDVWDSLDARSDICSGTRCPKHAECFVTRMRERGDRAEVVVVNHHLLLADLALRGRAELAGQETKFGQVLPEADYLIIDEAHTLESIASEQFGGTLSYGKIERLLQDIVKLGAESQMSVDTTDLVQGVARVGSACMALFAELPSSESRVPLTHEPAQFGGLRAAGRRAEEALTRLREALNDVVHHEPSAEALRRRTQELEDSLSFVIQSEDSDYVYWAEGSGGKGKLGASPVDVGALLGRFLFGRFKSTILTSATLSTGSDRFRYFCTSVGAPEDTRTLALETAFDYQKQAALLIPRHAPDPDDPRAEQWRAEVAEQVIMAMGGGALFLCTSHKGMQSMYRHLSKKLPFPCLLQGQKPKRQLIADFKSQAPAVLFATQSFWEGVDIPGDSLRLVLVDRLPFDVPSDPLVKARAERLKADGQNPFAHDQLPRAILRLKQGFGRLIRTRYDRGAVVILDARLTKRSYGARFIRALPSATRIDSLEALTAWWAEEEKDEV